MNVGLITARGGSKGIPHKNIYELNGKPLIYWTIEAALSSRYLDVVYVSTEDPIIAQISLDFGASVINRPLELAQDTTGSEPVISHAINYLTKKCVDVENICLLQPTSPLRNSLHIDDAYRLFYENDANCILSVFEPKHHPAKSYKKNIDGSLSGLFTSDSPYCRRQDLPEAFQPNGGIYLFSVASFMLNEQIPRERVFPLIMSELESIDIDSLDDLRAVDMIMRGLK